MKKNTFKKVLIANRGEIAQRILQALKKSNTTSVALFHYADRHAPWVTQANEAIEIEGASPTAAHLDINQILTVCRNLDIDAVHPGYGFLSENAEFARRLSENGITFIGPDADIIELMGDKIRSREFVAEQGYAVPPSVTLNAGDNDCINAVAHMPYPLVVKASAGGGGKGMSIVHSPDELASTLRIAASEAEKYFGDSRIYVERYFASARHIEVQILGDGTNIVHLGERECSIQRRFQKIIEEAPSVAISTKRRSEICDIAVGIARAANYKSAGTIEFLYTPEGEFFFLEMNTRIQVEHPVTEMIYEFDLVRAQIDIAAGNALDTTQGSLEAKGHAIECRICAEDAFNGFLPETGKVLHIKTPDDIDLRWESGIYPHQTITTAFDPLLAKLVVHGETREQSIEKMKAALKQLAILGIETNINYLIAVLSHPDFENGDFDTGFLKKNADQFTPPALSDEHKHALVSLSFLADQSTQQLFEATPAPYGEMGNWKN